MTQKQFNGDWRASQGRTLHALEMRRAGWTLRQIGVVLGISGRSAWAILAHAEYMERRRNIQGRARFKAVIAKQQRANAAVLDGLTKLRIICGREQ